MFLITGILRSGTNYTSKILRAVGQRVYHEKFGDDGLVSWVHAHPGLYVHEDGREWHIEECDYDVVLHQVRHPLKVIGSLQSVGESSMKYLSDFVDTPSGANKLLAAMYAWVDWNTHCEHISEYTYQLENIEEEWDTICNKLSIGHHSLPSVVIPNSRKSFAGYKTLTWKDLDREDIDKSNAIKSLATHYGYNIGSSL